MSGDPCPKVFREKRPAKRLKAKPKPRPSELARNTRFLLETVDHCQACDLIAEVVPGWTCGLFPVDPHHRRRQGPGRSKGGGHMLANLILVCRTGHSWIHDIQNQDQARALGLLLLPGDPGWDALELVKEEAA